MTCLPSTRDIERCPSTDELLPQFAAMLPRGRAWSLWPGTTIWKFWRAIAAVFADLEARICALRLEFWCATQTELRAAWLNDYGLPDSCDPFPDLCAKVSAIGGQTCSYFQAVAAKAGWSITCVNVASVGFGCMNFGCTPIGRIGDPGGSIRIRINTAASSAYASPVQRAWMFGKSNFGQPLGCSGDVSPLKCILARILPAHATVTYEVV